MKTKLFILFLGFASLISCRGLTNQDAPSPLPINHQPAIEKFVNEVAPQYGLTPEQTRKVLAKAEFQPSIINKMTRPTEAKAWGDYRTLLITPKRVAAGKNFMKQYASTFALAESRYGVPREMISSIHGIETFYGKNLGKYRVLDALATLSFGFPHRASFFQKELARYIALAEKNNWDVTALRGSYAGAFGWPQFMPSAYMNFAVSALPGRSPNLYDPKDAILSVGNYFKTNGWVPGGPVAIRVTISPKTCVQLTCNHRKPLYPVAEWKRAGVKVPQNINDHLPASIVLLKMDDGQETWMVFHNFYVITTYNISINYGMAAFELSRAL